MPTPAGLEPGDGGHAIGRDPRTMTQGELRAMGHEPMSPLAAIRLRCLDCCGEQPSEVLKCTAVRCAAWPFRMNRNPWRAERELSDEQREVMRERGRTLAARTHGKRGDIDNQSSELANPPVPATTLPAPSDLAEKPRQGTGADGVAA